MEDVTTTTPPGTAIRVMVAAWFMGFLMWGLLLSVSSLLPSIQEEMGLSFALRSLVLSLPFLLLAVSAIPGGYLSDRVGIRRTVALGALVAVGGSGLRGLPGPSAFLLVAAAVFGVGLGLVIPNLPKLVSQWSSSQRGGLPTGIYSTGIILGSVVGIYATLPLAEALGSWRQALLVWTGLGVITLALWLLLVPGGDVRHRQSSRGYRDLLTNRNLWILAFIFAAGNASYFFLIDAYPEFLFSRGLGREQAAGQLALLVAIGIPAIFIAPVLSDRVGLRRPFLWAPHLLIATLMFLLPTFPLGAVWFISMGFGLTEMTIFALALLIPVDLFRRDEVGRASGIILSVAYVGALLGPLGFGLIVDLTASIELALSTYGALSLVTLGVVFLLPESGGRGRA